MLAVLLVSIPSASAEDLTQTGQMRWVAIASRADRDEAIAMAAAYKRYKARVVTSDNGYFAVVLGPYKTSSISDFRETFDGPPLPSDAYLTVGKRYLETVWPTASEATAAAGDVEQPGNSPEVRVGGAGGKGGDAQVIIYGGNIYLSPQGGAGGKGGDAPQAAGPERISRCTLKAFGKNVMDASGCSFQRAETHFTLSGPSANGKSMYEVSVVYNADDTGEGSLIGGKSSEKSSLGTMTRNGACWLSLDETSKICAWK